MMFSRSVRGALALFALASASTVASQGDSRLVWFRAADRGAEGRPKAFVLMIHGLNTRPDAMRGIAGLLNSVGIDALNVGLSGHNGNLEAFKTVTRDLWIEDAMRGFRAARSEADEAGAPLYFVGFSLGGVLGLDLLTGKAFSSVRFDRMILFAPAISLRARSYLIRALAVFGPRLIVPSSANEAYRANRSGTSNAAYKALFDLIRDLGGGERSRANIPTLVFIDPKDELVSESGLKSLIDSWGLGRWTLREISNRGATIDPSYHHLIIDEASLGPEGWGEVSAAILGFLGEP